MAVPAAGAVAAAKAERGAVSPASGTPASESSVTVSAAARSLDATAVGSGIDEAKVSAVKAAIADGSFKVDAGAIADKLLSNAQEFLSRTRS